MKIKEIEIENILSIEKLKLTIQDSGLVLVEGWNHDAGRANGAGKTAIFNALSFGLYGKLPRKVTASEILRRQCKTGWVKVVVACGQETWTVTRSRPNGLSFLNGQVPALITQEEWEAKLRLSYDQFLMSMYCAQRSDTVAPRFLLTPDTDKKKFLLQLLGLNVFSDAKKATDLKIGELQSSLVEIKNKREVLESKIDVYSESLIDENVYNHNVAECNKSIADMTALLIEAQQIPRPNLSKYTKLEEGASAKRIEFARAKAKRETLVESFKKLSRAISDSPVDMAACPTCGNVLDSSHTEAIREKELGQLSAERSRVQGEITALDDVLAGESRVIQLLQQVRERKTSESADYDSARTRINDLSTKITLKQRELRELSLKLESNADLYSKIKALSDTREKSLNNEQVISTDLELYKTISNLYSPTGAQAYILDSVIDFFNEAADKHIELLWPNASYTLTSYKENVKGDITAKFSEILTMEGKNVSVGSLSGGELKALSLCADFSILDVLESQFGIALNPIILDEPFEGLDAAGREIVIELLEKLAKTRQIFVVDHASEAKAMFSNVIRVEKLNGLSSIVLDP